MVNDDDQYRTSSTLNARIGLHGKYGGGGRLAAIHRHAEIAPGAHVLEVGCGTGRFWAQGAALLPDDLELTLTDSSPAMVTEAGSLVSSLRKWKHVRTLTARVEQLPFEDGEFDYAIAMHMLYHAADPRAALRELGRVLRPGAKLLVTTNGTDNLQSVFRLRAEAFGGPAFDLGAMRFGLEAAPALIAETFTLLKAETYHERLEITDPEDVVTYLSSSLAGRDTDGAKQHRLRRLVDAAFAANGGVLETQRITGYILAQR